MTRVPRLLVAIAAILLALSPSLPVWRISLVAPQYPEGLGMVIRMDSVTGIATHDLENINQLNHYIGMRVIETADLPELQYMGRVVLTVAALGILAALVGRRWSIVTWGALFGVTGALGMFDFWWRTYTYGHTLDVEHAPIRIPGQGYQPPLIGVKQILNFTASAWPATGGWLILAAAALTAVAVWLCLRRGDVSRPSGIFERIAVAHAH